MWRQVVSNINVVILFTVQYCHISNHRSDWSRQYLRETKSVRLLHGLYVYSVAKASSYRCSILLHVASYNVQLGAPAH